MVGWHHQLNGLSLRKLQEIVKDREAWHAACSPWGCKESAFCIRWPKYWNFRFRNSPSNEYSGLISFRIGWFELLAVQGTLKSLLQHHSSKASILCLSAFLMFQLSHPYMTIGKTIVLILIASMGDSMPILMLRELREH